MIEIVVPQIGETTAEVTLIEWLKEEGDPVLKGDPLFEVDTDKTVVTVEAFADGVLAQILMPPGSQVMPRQVVGLLTSSIEEVSPGGEASSGEQDAAPSTSKLSPVGQRVAAELGVDPKLVMGTGSGGRVTASDVRHSSAQHAKEDTPMPKGERSERPLSSPKARSVAEELGVDLTGLIGTGIGGLITVKDVQAAARSTLAAREPSGAEPLSKLRRTIATRMTASKQTVPHFYLMADVEMTAVRWLREYCRETLGWDAAPTYTSIFVRACALGLAVMPELNVSYTDGGLVRRPTVDIGIAVATDEGLFVPVLPGADGLGLRQTLAQTRELAERARQRRLRERDLGGKSLIVTNLGMFGVDAFAAIIDPPDPMILAIGRVSDRVVPVDGQPNVRPMCTLTLSVDHRVLDGVLGARFLARVKSILEHPFEILG